MFPPPDGSQMEWLYQDKCRGLGSNFPTSVIFTSVPCDRILFMQTQSFIRSKMCRGREGTRGTRCTHYLIPKTLFFHNIIWMSFELWNENSASRFRTQTVPAVSPTKTGSVFQTRPAVNKSSSILVNPRSSRPPYPPPPPLNSHAVPDPDFPSTATRRWEIALLEKIETSLIWKWSTVYLVCFQSSA